MLDTSEFYNNFSHFPILPNESEALYKTSGCFYNPKSSIVYMHVIDSDSATTHKKDLPYIKSGKMILLTSVIDHSKIKPSDVLVYP